MTLPSWCFDIVTLWSMCRGPEGGMTIWPDSGGMNDQSSFVIAAFGVLGGAEADYQGWRKNVRGES